MPEWRGRDIHGKGAIIVKIAIVGLDLADTKSLTSESMKMPNPGLAKVLKRLH
ncbi:hypothetical protein B0G77_7861 [Paraburkholderia sp. BL10I2N1]|nr:hypothetical protein B0G77_7861 [Paraburkholderia sp. BL10I2N1]